MVVQAVSNFKVNNSRSRITNYYENNNYMSRASILNQPADSFSKSNGSSQVSFKGNPMALVKGKGKLAKVGEGFLADAGKKVGGIARRVGEEATEAIGGTVRKIKGKNKLPEVKKPVIAKLQSDSSLLKELGSVYNSLDSKSAAAKAIANYSPSYISSTGALAPGSYNKIKDLISTAKADPSFKGLAGAASDFVPDVAKETAKEVGSTIASSAAGEAVKAVGAEVGQFVVEEVIGEAGMQVLERSLDCILPGVGLSITGLRWLRRVAKAKNIIDKL